MESGGLVVELGFVVWLGGGGDEDLGGDGGMEVGEGNEVGVFVGVGFLEVGDRWGG